MWEALQESVSDVKRKVKKVQKRQRPQSERIKVAKLEVSEEKRAKALQYMGDGMDTWRVGKQGD